MRPDQIADLRALADRAQATPGDYDTGTQLHEMLDAYEDTAEVQQELDDAEATLENAREAVKEISRETIQTLKAVGGLAETAASAIEGAQEALS